MTDEVLDAIKKILSAGYRVELIPLADGKIKVIQVRRKEIKA